MTARARRHEAHARRASPTIARRGRVGQGSVAERPSAHGPRPRDGQPAAFFDCALHCCRSTSARGRSSSRVRRHSVPSAATARSKGDDDRTKKRASLRGEGARGGAAAGGRAQQCGAAVCEAVLAACPCGERRWGEEDERVSVGRRRASASSATRGVRAASGSVRQWIASLCSSPNLRKVPVLCRLAWRARTERSKWCLASTWSRKRKLARLALDDEPCASLSLSFRCSRSSCTTKLRPYEQHRSARPAAEEPRKPVEQSNLQAASIPASASKPTCPRTRSAHRTPRFFLLVAHPVRLSSLAPPVQGPPLHGPRASTLPSSSHARPLASFHRLELPKVRAPLACAQPQLPAASDNLRALPPPPPSSPPPLLPTQPRALRHVAHGTASALAPAQSSPDRAHGQHVHLVERPRPLAPVRARRFACRRD